MRNMVLLVAALLSLIIVFGSHSGNARPGDVFDALFMSVSAFTTTGWSTEGARSSLSGSTAFFILLAVTTIGCAVTSTTGGFKLMRFIVLVRHGARELARLAHPNGVAVVRYMGRIVGERDLQAIWLAMGAFVLTLMGGIVLLAMQGHSFPEAYILAVSSLTTAGALAHMADPAVFPGYQFLSESDYSILGILMMLGRLETSLLLAVLTRSFWRA